MDTQLAAFKAYLIDSNKLSGNSVTAYLSDLADFAAFLRERGAEPAGASKADVAAYLLGLKQSGRSAATVNRKLASIRAYYKYLMERGILSQSPASALKSPRIQRKEIEYLTIEEVDRLLAAPADNDIGLRDTAILEMLYATGLRVTELMYVNVDDINLRMGFVSCDGAHGKARIIPLGRPARAALEKYIYDVRPHFRRDAEAGRGRGGKAQAKSKSKDDGALFLNYYGERITRQALWKILRGYAEKAEIKKNITPQILRNSFAVHMIQNGADLKSVQELMGHEDPIATQAYLAVSKNRIKDVYDSAHPRA
ncbi:MAG: tyrosine-type recombinase/integrase [Clostridiales Family XIII bacterium]|jgi:integrase/recombinase XerD|nr:tyrosine-type recombinase/integrase [Clostridiales Family XIII bacterium]